MKITKINNDISFKSLASEKIARDVGKYVLGFRRPFKNEVLSKESKEYLLSIIAEKSLPFINKEEPIPMTIVGFSMKCPSPLKVISQNADRAEFESLKHLNNFTSEFSEIYKPGAKLDIFADGRMFAKSIIGFTDEKITQYVSQLKTFLKNFQLTKLQIHTPEDYISGNFDEIRSRMVKEFPANRQKINADTFTQEYRRFMRDFYAKDIRAQDKSISIKESKKMGEQVADEVISAANTYSDFVKSLYPEGMIRLSVHGKPFDNGEKKIGIFLNSQKSNCPMPWHSAAFKVDSKNKDDIFLYEKKIILEKSGAKLMPNEDGKGCFYGYACRYRKAGLFAEQQRGSVCFLPQLSAAGIRRHGCHAHGWGALCARHPSLLP